LDRPSKVGDVCTPRILLPAGLPAQGRGPRDDDHQIQLGESGHRIARHRESSNPRGDRPTEVLHIGDHDPSGLHLFLAFAEDVEAFSRELGSGDVTFTRLAPEQIARLGLETAPPKATDRRAFRGETCQAEAIAPDVLAQILRDAIDARIDQRALQAVIRRERQARRELLARLGAER
jgi:hypothetical protein